MAEADICDVRGLEVVTVQFDLGFQGLGILAGLALAFGLAAQFVGRAGTRWDWLIGAAGWFIGGLVASEVIWGTLTVAEIQPIIDGLAFDEALLGGLIGGLVAWLATRFVSHGSPFYHRPVSP
ncbi:MAG TPA: hypothetical protein VI733_02690 [Candidatus Limnocylindria bacterium]|nr:hypothetical protein [Candidatus Limnocylindria bacterium]